MDINRQYSLVSVCNKPNTRGSRQELHVGVAQNCGEGVRVSCLVQVSRYERVFSTSFCGSFCESQLVLFMGMLSVVLH